MTSLIPDSIETYSCSNCGATTSFDPGSRTLRCAFCGTEMAVRASAAAVELDVEQYVLPFKVQKADSEELIRKWLGSSFWAPSDLKSRSALNLGQGIYVPFWRFDADASSLWEGEISRTHTRSVQKTRTNSEGRQETYTGTETYKTWHPRNGTHQGSHRTWVPASTGLTQAEGDRLMPFPEEAMMTYSPDLLVGFAAEDPGIDEDGAWSSGEQRIREMERAACAREVERLTRADITLSNRRSAVCYLPVWIYGYDYQQQHYRVLVNGHTGEIVGDRPVSKARVGVAVGIGVTVLVFVILLIVLFSG
jgi:hypothetical protein